MFLPEDMFPAFLRVAAHLQPHGQQRVHAQHVGRVQSQPRVLVRAPSQRILARLGLLLILLLEGILADAGGVGYLRKDGGAP